MHPVATRRYKFARQRIAVLLLLLLLRAFGFWLPS
jgi:hypothetical protein